MPQGFHSFPAKSALSSGVYDGVDWKCMHACVNTKWLFMDITGEPLNGYELVLKNFVQMWLEVEANNWLDLPLI
jgi:hypothetical protein